MTTTDDEQKTKERLEQQQLEAKAQIEQILATSRPKNIQEGVTTGVSNIVAGAVGAVGIAVLAPTLGATMGAQNGGLVGGAFGLVGGAVVGVVGAAAIAVGGAVQGVTQVVRGVAAIPDSLIQPRRGKWWNDADGKWVLTNLEEEKKSLQGVPEDDGDILGDAQNEVDQSFVAGSTTTTVADMFYYNTLDVDPTADGGKIKRQYYVLARKYHPDKLEPGDKEGAEKFKDIAEAYQVLSDPELRAKYDKDGRDGLSPDKTEVNQSLRIDPTILFAFLFGSDKFNDYVGRLATATSASVGDSPKVSITDARTIQRRRCLRLALKLADKLAPWTIEDYEVCKVQWQTEADELSKASYGFEMVHLIGKVYTLSAVQFLGDIDAGVGLPSVSKWASAHWATLQQKNAAVKSKIDTTKAAMDVATVQAKAAQKIDAATSEEEINEIKKMLEQDLHNSMLNLLWTTTAVDITNTLHETAEMVMFDHHVDDDTRKRRARGLKKLGEIFSETPAGSEHTEAKAAYEEAAFAAMLETMKRRDEAASTAK